MKGFFLFIAVAVIVFVGCSSTKVDLSGKDLEKRFNKGMGYFEKKKYYRAQEEFEYVLLRGKHTELGDDAQFYLAESYFLNKEYILAISEYERLVRQMTYSPFVEEARWRICQSYFKKSPKYYHDQDYTVKAIDKLQEFIEDYPNSDFREIAVETIGTLRDKLARKVYESGILYIKLEEYNSAITYFEDLLLTYYDTLLADQARVKIIEVYIKENSLEDAQKFLDQNESKFQNKKLLKTAKSLIADGQSKKRSKDGS